jgi:antitoxin (DNA-binding transcriptional repressor) of toxin-antitoxin stability system
MQLTIGIGQLRGDTRAYVRQVADGDTLFIKRRGKVVARLDAVPPGLHRSGVRFVRSHDQQRLAMVKVSQLRAAAGQYFDRVSAGESLLVVYDDNPVALISSALSAPAPANIAAGLAWALAEAATPCLKKGMRTIVYARVGAGDDHKSIEFLLALAAQGVFPIPSALLVRLGQWVDGYRGHDDEQRLRRLLGRAADRVTAQQPKVREH